MQIKNRWTPPIGTLTTKQKWRDQIVFPVVFGRTVQDNEQEEERTHFGLWLVHQKTGVARFVEAPFYMKSRYYGHPFNWKGRWLSRGQHDGSLIYCMSKNQSYDIGYHLFLFDGEQWTQIRRSQRHIRSLTMGIDHELHVWTTPEEVGSPFLFEGGSLLRAYDPTRFAVDYTHAFAYDSGPDTPCSPEFLALKEEIESKPLIPRNFIECPTAVKGEAVSLIGEQCNEEGVRTSMFELDGAFWLGIYQSECVENAGFQEFIQLTKNHNV